MPFTSEPCNEIMSKVDKLVMRLPKSQVSFLLTAETQVNGVLYTWKWSVEQAKELIFGYNYCNVFIVSLIFVDCVCLIMSATLYIFFFLFFSFFVFFAIIFCKNLIFQKQTNKRKENRNIAVILRHMPGKTIITRYSDLILHKIQKYQKI